MTFKASAKPGCAGSGPGLAATALGTAARLELVLLELAQLQAPVPSLLFAPPRCTVYSGLTCLPLGSFTNSRTGSSVPPWVLSSSTKLPSVTLSSVDTDTLLRAEEHYISNA